MKAAGRVLSAVVRAYQVVVSPALPRACRFEPTCSEYYRQALALHDPFRASWLAVRRVARCHPWHPGGYDPTPPPRARNRVRA